jgi:hypothetical protein
LSSASALSRSPWFRRAAALSRFAPMANYSIPNSIPAIGRISTPLSRQSRKQNSASTSFFEAQRLAQTIHNRTSSCFNAQPSTPNLYSWTWGVFCLESEGCLVVLAVFKTVVGSAYRDRGRFDSYPLRFFQRELAIANCGLADVNLTWERR